MEWVWGAFGVIGAIAAIVALFLLRMERRLNFELDVLKELYECVLCAPTSVPLRLPDYEWSRSDEERLAIMRARLLPQEEIPLVWAYYRVVGTTPASRHELRRAEKETGYLDRSIRRRACGQIEVAISDRIARRKGPVAYFKQRKARKQTMDEILLDAQDKLPPGYYIDDPEAPDFYFDDSDESP